MWAFPWLTWATLALMAAVLGLMLNDDSARPQVLWSTYALVVVLAFAGLRELRARRAR
jgi:aromatic amino acid permease